MTIQLAIGCPMQNDEKKIFQRMQKIATINVKFLAKTCDRDSKKP
jgi:hypothetical protein